MLSILKRGTVDAGGTTWEFHGDSESDTIFYITPQPQYVMKDGLPAIEIVQYETTDSANGSGYVQLQLELGVPQEAIAPITAKIKQLYNVDNPVFQTLPVQSGTIINITYPDGQGGTTGVQVQGSDFAANYAVAQLPLDADQMTEVKKIMGGGGSSPFEIQYAVIVPAFMPGVTAEISFDASIAYKYQVTSHAHTKWAHKTTYTYDISQSLTQSDASKIEITKVDPTVPQSVVDDVRNWAQSVVQARVADEVKQQLAILEKAGGTQSFSIDQVASFTESYAENETIMWRVRPTATLPSFGQLGLTVAQIAQLEPTVDNRKFVATITPAVSFVEASGTAPHASLAGGAITKGENPFMDDIKKLTALEVTVVYPTLSGSQERTFTFKSNQPHVWTADWDDTAGGVYAIRYTANYEGGQQISGEKKAIDDSEMILQLADVGILNVTFNATKFFANQSGGQKTGSSSSSGVASVESLIVDFVFEVPDQPPFLQPFTLDAKTSTYTVSSVFSAPISTYYDFTLTYTFKPETKANPFTSNVKRQNSQMVYLPAPDFQQTVNILAAMGAGSGASDFLQLDMDYYYEGTPVFPEIPASAALPRPTQSSPIQFSFKPGTDDVQNASFTIFANSAMNPLMLNASGVTSDGDMVNWGPLQFDPAAVTMLFYKADKLFVFVELSPELVVWDKGPTGTKDTLLSIDVRVTEAHYTSEGKDVSVPLHGLTQTIGFVPALGKANAAFFQVTGLSSDYSGLKFDWEATYQYQNAGSLMTSQTTAGNKVALPAAPPQGTKPQSKPAEN